MAVNNEEEQIVTNEHLGNETMATWCRGSKKSWKPALESHLVDAGDGGIVHAGDEVGHVPLLLSPLSLLLELLPGAEQIPLHPHAVLLSAGRRRKNGESDTHDVP